MSVAPMASTYGVNKLYVVRMKNGARLTIVADCETRAEQLAFHQYHQVTGKWMGVETAELAEGYDIA